MYGIMRVEKRGRADVYGIQLEANRTEEQHEKGLEFDKSDIDWNKTRDNIFLVQTEQWNREITKAIKRIETETGKKTRKDAVVLLDGLFTASPEFFANKSDDEIKKYFEDCLDFYVKEYCQGDETRVLNAVIHLDEATPHMQVASIPVYTSESGNRLNAKIIMGNKTDYRKRQDRFFEAVSEKYGLERGEPASAINDKVHTTKREWQAATQEEAIAKNNQVLTAQKEEYTKTKKKLKDTAEKIDLLTAEAVDKLKVNKVTDILNRDTVTVDRKSYESLKAVNDNINKSVKTITEAENIEEKKAELQQIKYEIRQARSERDEIKNDYANMKGYLSANKGNLELTISNARLEQENDLLKNENELLKVAIVKVSDFIEKHNIPETIKRGVQEIIGSLKQKQAKRDIHR